MTARGTDWGLAALVAVLVAGGFLSWFAAEPWVAAVHGVAGGALAVLLAWKVRRVWRRVGRPTAGLAALVLVALTLLSGFAWGLAGSTALAGYTLLAWHVALGGVLGVAVLGHAVLRAKPLRRRDVAGRRQLLHAAAIGVGGLLVWRLPGAERRFTGSYEVSGPEFPVTSWIADDPPPLGDRALRLTGEVERELTVAPADCDAGHELVAVLDCTGGFYTEQRWRGIRLGELLDRAGPTAAASHVRVVSVTGYRWSFALEDARELLLATHVAGEPLSHGHGAPVRLVAPGRRGFQWVKWITAIEVHDGPDPGAFPSTLVSWL